MKRSMSALWVSVAIWLIGCDNKPVSEATPHEPVLSIQDTTRMGVVKACEKQDLKTRVIFREKYEKEYREWFKSCDPRVQFIVQHSKELNYLIVLGRFREHTDIVNKTQKIFESVDGLSPENQKRIRGWKIWTQTIERGDFTGLGWVNWVAEHHRRGMDIMYVEDDKN